MKIRETLSILMVALIGSLILFFAAAERATSREKSRSDTYEIKSSQSLPKGAQLVEVKKDQPPPLFQFVFDSDYVVIASAGDLISVGTRDRKPINSNEFDINEWMAGAVYPIHVESILFSKKAFHNNVKPVPVLSLQTFKNGRTFDGGDLQKGTRYLLFLREIPKDDEIFTKFELGRDHTYYQTVTASESLYPNARPSMEGPSKRGEINLSNSRHSKLFNSILRYCEALSSPGKDDKIQRLQKLLNSDDALLRESSEYTIKYLDGALKKLGSD